jgi:hypothetical protein
MDVLSQLRYRCVQRIHMFLLLIVVQDRDDIDQRLHLSQAMLPIPARWL